MPIIQVQVGKNIVEDVFTRRNVVHSNHIFATTMQLMSKPTYFTTSNVLLLHVHVVQLVVIAYVTIEKVEPNFSCRCDYNLQLI
jgi:hypothetical protein